MTKPLILFDLTRLLSATGRSAPTGIERVEYAYARWLLETSSAHVRFVVTMSSSVRLIADTAVPAFLEKQAAVWADGARGFSAAKAIANVNRFLFGTGAPPAPKFGYLSPEERQQRREIQSLASTAAKPLTNWAQQMASSWAREPLGPLIRRSALRRPVVYLRASMDRMERPEPLGQVKELANVKMVTFCHDIIPLDYPEYVRPVVVSQYAERVQTMAKLSDGIILGSKYNASRLAPLLFPHRPRMTVAPIGVDVPPPPREGMPPVADEPFFLVVSTIEARKNHLLLLNIWRRLVAELGAATPKLVIVGKRGWEAQTPLAILDRARELGPYVYEAGAIPDEALHVLLRRATAVLMPSFVEGFGLPVVEALAVDTPVIASDIPVFRELVGNFAELLDPLDGPSWRRAILDYAQPGSQRREAALARARAYSPPTWDTHFRAVEDLVSAVISAPALSLAERARQALGSAPSFGYPGAAVAWDGRSDGRRA
jgi:glycosyltransferase involved in cell wall biosynthesis